MLNDILTIWPVTENSQSLRLSINCMTLIPSLTFTEYEWFPWGICKWCDMPAGYAYPFGHLVPSPFGDLFVLQLFRLVVPAFPCLFATPPPPLGYPSVLSRFSFQWHQQFRLYDFDHDLWSTLVKLKHCPCGPLYSSFRRIGMCWFSGFIQCHVLYLIHNCM